MERVDSPASSASQEVVPSLVSAEVMPDVVVPLADLVARARGPGAAGNAALLELIAALETLTPNAENAAALVDLLDGHSFDTLKTADGSPTRELAIRALLRLGWPYALHVAPEDLAWLRGRKIAAIQRNVLLILGLAGAGVAAWNLISGLL